MRVARDASGTVRVGAREPGRGAWLCAGGPACFDRAARRGALARALRRPLSDAELGALRARLYGTEDESTPDDSRADPARGTRTTG